MGHKRRSELADSAALVAHEENPALQHQFSTEEQQFDTATLGMWTFIVSEVLFFGGMFVSYAVFRGLYPQAFAAQASTWRSCWARLIRRS